MGSTGDSPVPLGDPPTGMAKHVTAKGLFSLATGTLPVPPGESPSGTGQWPVLPKVEFPNRLKENNFPPRVFWKCGFWFFFPNIFDGLSFEQSVAEITA